MRTIFFLSLSLLGCAGCGDKSDDDTGWENATDDDGGTETTGGDDSAETTGDDGGTETTGGDDSAETTGDDGGTETTGGDDSAETTGGDDGDTTGGDDGTDGLRIGEELIIELPSNASTGYAWDLREPADSAIVDLESVTYVMDDAPDGMSGVGGTEVFQFRATGVGSTTIRLEYVRSWEPDASADTHTQEVTVIE